MNGALLCDLLSDSGNDPTRFISLVLAQHYLPYNEYSDKERPIYEVTTSFHGDIEWAYVFKFNESYKESERCYKRDVSIAWQELSFLNPNREIIIENLSEIEPTKSIEDFRAFINTEIKEYEARLAAYNARKVA